MISKTTFVLSVLLCVMRFAVFCAHADDWPTYEHDVAHTGRSGASVDPLLLTKVWGVTESAPVYPVVAGNSLYEIRPNGTVRSLNLFTGQTNWSTSISGIWSEPTYAEGLLISVVTTVFSPTKLYVWDAASGAQKYTVDLPQIGFSRLTPAIARNSNNQLVAYVSGTLQSNGTPGATAITLGSNSGSVLWTSGGSFGTQSMPTLVGNSIVLAGPDQYYALDQLTGASNHFFSGSSSGGGGTTVAFDSSRMQFYVRDDIEGMLTAYSYTSNSVISQVWQIPMSPFAGGGSVSIGADGGVYLVASNTIIERDPGDGHVLRSLGGLHLSNDTTPTLSANSIYVYGDSSVFGNTEIYDIGTLSHVRTLPLGRTDFNTAYQSPGAVFDGGYVSYYHSNTTTSGFDVYFAVPEPLSCSLITCGLILAAGIVLNRRLVSR